jgi:hypothetical protein
MPYQVQRRLIEHGRMQEVFGDEDGDEDDNPDSKPKRQAIPVQGFQQGLTVVFVQSH